MNFLHNFLEKRTAKALAEQPTFPILKEYAKKYAMPWIRTSAGELKETRDTFIIFMNGKIASIIPVERSLAPEDYNGHKFAIAMCDWEGNFDWETLNRFVGSDDGIIYTDSELECVIALECIARLEA